jgi:alpha-D-xyloside xylohydrolase
MYDFPADAAVQAVGDQWTLGGSVLAAPVLVQGAASRSVVFPLLPDVGAVGGGSGSAAAAGEWFEFNSTATHAVGTNVSFNIPNLSTMLVFVRAGSILTLSADGVQYTAALETQGALDVHVYGGADGAFALVEDDGETYAYNTGVSKRTAFKWDDTISTLSWNAVGTYSSVHVFTKLVVTVFRAGASASDWMLLTSAVCLLKRDGWRRTCTLIVSAWALKIINTLHGRWRRLVSIGLLIISFSPCSSLGS